MAATAGKHTKTSNQHVDVCVGVQNNIFVFVFPSLFRFYDIFVFFNYFSLSRAFVIKQSQVNEVPSGTQPTQIFASTKTEMLKKISFYNILFTTYSTYYYIFCPVICCLKQSRSLKCDISNSITIKFE
jgi:hypothetical protein